MARGLVSVVRNSIVLRWVWQGAADPACMGKARKKVNRKVTRVFLAIGGSVMQHRDICYNQPEFFRHDGIHLSDGGTDIWLQNVGEWNGQES